MDTAEVDEREHSYSSLKWVIERGIHVKSIQIRESKRKEIVATMFEGICVPSLLSIDLRYCSNVTDAVISSISIGCCHLGTLYSSE
jgi:hypothetical protein